MARPTKFKEEYVEQAYVACKEGFTDEKLAEIFNVHRDSIYEWRKQYPEFEKAIRNGKDEFDSSRVEKALVERAVGIAIAGKYFPPDPVSMIFWLKNRQPERWKDVKSTEHSGKITLEDAVKQIEADE